MRNLLVVCFFLLIVSGCGKGSAPTAHLGGSVTINGQPVPADAEASLSFEPVAGGKAVSATIADGRYDAANVPQGPVLVRFYISRRIGPVKISERTGKEFQEVANIVPAQHAAGMQIEVTGDNTSQDFNL